MQCISQSFTVVSLLGLISKDIMNESTFNKQEVWRNKIFANRSTSQEHLNNNSHSRTHVHVLFWNKTYGLTASLWRYS